MWEVTVISRMNSLSQLLPTHDKRSISHQEVCPAIYINCLWPPYLSHSLLSSPPCLPRFLPLSLAGMSSSGHPRSRKGKEIATSSQRGATSEGVGKLVSYTTHLIIQFRGEWLVVSDARLTRVDLTTFGGRLEIVSDIASKYEYVVGQRILIIWSGAKHASEQVIALFRQRFTEVATKTRNIDLKAVADAVNNDFDGHYSGEYFCILDSQNKTTTGLVTMTPRKSIAGWIVANVKNVASSVSGIGSGSITAIHSFLKATNGLQLQDLNEAQFYMKQALDKASEADEATGGNYSCNMSTKKGGWDYATLS